MKQLGKTARKSPVFRDDTDQISLKRIAEQQNPVGLRPGTAAALQRRTAQLRLGIAGKRHAGFLPFLLSYTSLLKTAFCNAHGAVFRINGENLPRQGQGVMLDLSIFRYEGNWFFNHL